MPKGASPKPASTIAFKIDLKQEVERCARQGEDESAAAGDLGRERDDGPGASDKMEHDARRGRRGTGHRRRNTVRRAKAS